MERRRFNQSERTALYLAAGGKCSLCGRELEPGWHADHISPWSKGGPTDVINGQALCATCNLKKGHRMGLEWPEGRRLRKWQERAFRKFVVSSKRDFMLVACPGAGKTTAALRMAFEELAVGRARRIVIICPTEHLKVQWAEAAAAVGISLDPFLSNSSVLSRDYDGAVLTYAQVAASPLVTRMLCREPTIAILDEIHHAGDEESWGEALKVGFESATRRLLLSGTPFRSKGIMPFVTFDGDKLEVDFDYSYGDALDDPEGVCRPIYFPTYEGKMEWYNRGRKYTSSFQDQLGDDDSSKRLRTALKADGDWIREVITDGNKRLSDIRTTHPDAAGLVVAMDNRHADLIAKRFQELTGEKPPVVHSAVDGDASAMIKRFGEGRDRWIVAVKMISEGVDIPRLRIGIYATNVTTELFFRQFAGRFVRMIPGLEEQSAYLLIPRDEVFVDIVRDIQKTRLQVLERDAEKATSGEPQTDDRVASTFVPISSTGEAHDVFHPDGVSIPQSEIQATERAMTAAGAPVCYDAAIIARAFRILNGAPPSAAPSRSRADVERPLHEQKRDLGKVVAKFVTAIVEMTDRQHTYETVGAELKKINGGLPKNQWTIEQHQRAITYLEAWRKRLANG